MQNPTQSEIESLDLATIRNPASGFCIFVFFDKTLKALLKQSSRPYEEKGTGWPTCRVGCRRCKTDVRDAKNIVACMHSANLPKGRPTRRGGSPRCKKSYHVLLRTTTYSHKILRTTTTYYHVLPRTTITYYYNHSFCISGSHRCMSAPLISLFC